MDGQSRTRPTIRDVATAAGVSIGTVSRVLNRHPNVHERTRGKILETMRALGYEPVFAARELGRGSRPTIGLSTGLGTRRLVPFFQVFLEHLTELRERLIKSLLGLLVAVVICFTFADHLLAIIKESIPEGVTLQALSPAEGIITQFKIAIVAGIFVAFPILFYI